MRTLLPLDNSMPHPENCFVPTPSHARVQRGDFVGKPEQPQQHDVSVSKLYQMKPIAFRCTSESTAHGQQFFWVSWKIKASELGKFTRGIEVDWIEVQNEDFAPPTITRKELSLGFPSDYTLPCLPTSAVKARPKELESMRWSILASTGHPKCAATLVENWLQKIGIITEDAHITNDDTQADEKQHGIDMVKELVRRQTHKGREVRSDLMNIQGFCRDLQ